jgi:release factor glutamine methyltransferase
MKADQNELKPQTTRSTLPSITPPLSTANNPVVKWPNLVWKLTVGTPVGRAILAAKQRLEDAKCDTPHLDAQMILAHILQVERSWLFAHHEHALSAAETDAFTSLINRRMQHEPVAYLVGHKEFYGLDFVVDRRVLIPRPETELLVDSVIDHVTMREEQPVSVVDVGTGSGAIALAIAANCPNAYLFAIDLSLDALAIAQQNVRHLDVRNQVTLLQGDLLKPLPTKVDMIVANLPYITNSDYQHLMADVRDYEPQLALEAGPQGLDAIARLLEQAPHHLQDHGLIFLEIGHDQGEAVVHLARTCFPQALSIRLRQDYHGHDRLVMIAL